MRAINAAGAAVTAANTSLNPGREACWTQTIRLYEELIPLCGLRDMYAPEPAIEAIDAFMHELASLIESHLDGHRTSVPVNARLVLRNSVRGNLARTHWPRSSWFEASAGYNDGFALSILRYFQRSRTRTT
jgi:hypothetical protein